jgi:hypothetical protein
MIFGGLYNYRYNRSPFGFDYFDCLFKGVNETLRVGFAHAWVEFNPFLPWDTETGSFDYPYSSLSRALALAETDLMLRVDLKPGDGVESSATGYVDFTRPCLIQAPLGPVTIGAE